MISDIILNKIKFFLGYSGWSKGQLVSEIKSHSWIVSDIEKEKAAGTCPQAAIDQNLRITSKERTINPNWDPSQIYIPRKERKEWDAIGLLGKLVVRRGQPIGANWILMKSNIGVDPNDSNIILDKYLVR